MASAGRFVATALLMLGGFAIWMAHLAVAYGATALACAGRVRAGVATATVAAATGLAFAGVGALLVHALRTRSGARSPTAAFTGTVTAFVAGLALVAIAWSAVAALLAPAC